MERKIGTLVNELANSQSLLGRSDVDGYFWFSFLNLCTDRGNVLATLLCRPEWWLILIPPAGIVSKEWQK